MGFEYWEFWEWKTSRRIKEAKRQRARRCCGARFIWLVTWALLDGKSALEAFAGRGKPRTYSESDGDAKFSKLDMV